MLFQEDEKSQQGNAAHGHHKTNAAQMRFVMAQKQRPVRHERQGEQCQLSKMRSNRTGGTSLRGYHGHIAKTVSPRHRDPKKSERSSYEWKVIEAATLISAASDGGIHRLRGKSVKNGSKQNVTIQFAPQTRTRK